MRLGTAMKQSIRVTISQEKVLGKSACPYSDCFGYILSFLLRVLDIQSCFIVSLSIMSSSYQSVQPTIAS
jgi:hypothetical protein